MQFGVLAVRAAVLALLTFAAIPAAVVAEPIFLKVDASAVPFQSVYRVSEDIPVRSGPITLLYPEWLGDTFAPTGPIVNLADLHIATFAGAALPWHREVRNIFAFDLVVPPRTAHLHVTFMYLGAPNDRVATTNIFSLFWSEVLLYPSNGGNDSIMFVPSLTLPDQTWHFATSLPGPRQSGTRVTWAPLTMRRLVDSPLDGCVNYRVWTLGNVGASASGGNVTLNACADTPAQLDAKPIVIDHLRAMVREVAAVFGARHWTNYAFLLTVSNVFAGYGVEHQESSDIGVTGGLLTTPAVLHDYAMMLGHEFFHSWDGKYRVPAGIYVNNLNTPYDDSLLWVYEGLTLYYGNVLAYRDGILSSSDWPDHIAGVYARFDNEPGRQWRSLGDTAISAQVLYPSSYQLSGERRGVDFYFEGELLWLRVDSIIRTVSHNKKNLDDFASEFFGGADTGPIQRPYTRADLLRALNDVAAYDWGAFFKQYVDDLAPHPPDAISSDGWKLVYTDQPSSEVGFYDFRYSIGMQVRLSGGEILDVNPGSPAWSAGLGIETIIDRVDGTAYTPDAMFDALKHARDTHQPIVLAVEKAGARRDVQVPYYGGPRYPHLEPVAGEPDFLTQVIAPRSPGP